MKQLFFNPHRMNAILQRGFDQTNLVGSVGGVTYRRVGGVTVASQKVPMHVEHTRTALLMLTRMKWVNLVALWKVINSTGWHPSFQRENRRISDFNMFLRANFAAANTFITKAVSRAYGCVVAPCRLTSGSFLSPVAVSVNGTGRFETDIAYLSALGNSTTLKAFSEEIIENNPGWNEFFDPSLIMTDGTVLQLSAIFEGGAGVVHSRKVDGETLCSTQDLVIHNQFLSNYQGLQAFNRAAESYGGVARNQLLTPDVVDDIIFQP